MIAVDTNVVVYAHRAELKEHRRAASSLKRLTEGPTPWALPVFCIGEFIRLVTHPRLFTPPSTLDQALKYVGALLDSPAARLLTPGADFVEYFSLACRDAGARGNLVFDAQIAALCYEHGVDRILTEDRDFSRFPRIQRVGLAD